MIINRQLDQQLDLGPLTIRALRSLTQTHVDAIAKAVGNAETQWTVQPHDDYNGYLSVIIELNGHDSPTFLVSGTTEQIELSMLDHHDRTLNCGSFFNIQAAIAKLAGLLDV